MSTECYVASMATEHEAQRQPFNGVGGPEWFDRDVVAQLDTDVPEPGERMLRLVAVAGIEGVVGRTAEDMHNGVRVLYVTLDGQHATERVIDHASLAIPGAIPAATHLEIGAPELSELADRHKERVPPILDAHRDVWLGDA